MSYVVVPEGQSPPFEVVDDQHHAAWIIIATALGVAILLVCWVIRIYVRVYLTSSFGIVDWIFAAASTVALVQSVMILVAAHYGFGTSVDLLEPSIVIRIQNMLVASDVFYIVTLYLTKMSIIAMFLQLTLQRTHNLASWAVGGICSAWLVVSVLLITVECEANRPWAPAAEHCKSLLPRWRFITALDIITEIAWPALAIAVVQGIQMPLDRKLVILSAFFTRLLTVIFTALRLYYEGRASQSTNPTLAFIEPYLWGETAMHYSLIACTAFCLRPFMMAVSTNYGTAGDELLTTSGGGNSGGSYALKAMSRSSRKNSNGGLLSTTSAAGERYEGRLNVGAEAGSTSVEATRHDRSANDAISVGSSESTKVMLRRDVAYTADLE